MWELLCNESLCYLGGLRKFLVGVEVTRRLWLDPQGCFFSEVSMDDLKVLDVHPENNSARRYLLCDIYKHVGRLEFPM